MYGLHSKHYKSRQYTHLASTRTSPLCTPDPVRPPQSLPSSSRNAHDTTTSSQLKENKKDRATLTVKRIVLTFVSTTSSLDHILSLRNTHHLQSDDKIVPPSAVSDTHPLLIWRPSTCTEPASQTQHPWRRLVSHQITKQPRSLLSKDPNKKQKQKFK